MPCIKLALPNLAVAAMLITSKMLNGQIEIVQKVIFFAHPPKNIASGVRLWLHLPVVQTTTAANRSRVRIFYSGHVQGVGFRYTAKTVAAGFEITGGVRNLPDGRVELIAEGKRTELETFCEAIRNAGLAGLIRDESIDWGAAQNEFHGFEIVR